MSSAHKHPSQLQSILILLICIPSLMLARGQASGVQDDAPWLRVSDGTLAVYTQTDVLNAGSVLRSFAQLRDVLAQASIFHINSEIGLKVVAFHSEKQFNSYRISAGSCAFFQQTSRAEYVVLQDLLQSHRDVSNHEFTHFVLAHSGVTLPLWLNEGLADFYSTYQVYGDRVTFGRSVPGRLSILRNASWLPVASLFDVGTGSSYYSDPTRMALFYSESWALAHMLVVSPSYANHFPEFIHSLNQGHSSAESLRIAFNKTPDEMQDDLHSYLDQQHLPLLETQLKAPIVNLILSSSAISNAEMDVTLGDLQPNNLRTQADVASRLTSASGQMPTRSDAEESLGYLALRQGKIAEARSHFERAIQRHSSDANVYFYLAHLNREAGLPASQIMPLLEQALALKPDLGDARLELALVATGDGHFAEAIEALKGLTTPRPENAYTAIYTEAYCYAHLDKFAEARQAISRAQTIAGSDHDRAELTELRAYVEEQAEYQKP